MKSIQWAHERCDEVGECLVWNQSTNSNGTPTAWHEGKGGASVPRIVFAMSKGWTLDDLKGLRVWATCQTPGCLKEDHLRAGTYRSHRAWQQSKGMLVRGPSAIAAMTASVRARPTTKGSMPTARAVRAMRAAGASFNACGDAHGMSGDMARKIVNNLCWREAMPGSSAFTFRP